MTFLSILEGEVSGPLREQESRAVRVSSPPQCRQIGDESTDSLRSQQMVIAAIERLPVGVTIADATKPDQPLIYVNRMFSEITGYARDEVIGRNCRFLQGSATDRSAVDEVRQAIAAGKRATVRLVNYRKDGSEFLNALVLEPIHDDAGRLIAFMGSQSDVTDEAKEKIEFQRQKMESIGRMMGGVAHEINNMLQPVILLVEEILDRGLVAEAGRPHLEIVLDCGRKSRQIVRDMLAFSRPAAAITEVQDPILLLHDNLPLLRQALLPNVVLSIRTTGAVPRVKINRNNFAQILLNLAINAAAAMQGEGELVIVLGQQLQQPTETPAQPCRSFARLQVIDTGCGMDQATLQRAFEPFFTTKPLGQGTGLGLSVVYGLVRDMGATIAIESEPGRGTTVTILIPGHDGEKNHGVDTDH